MVKIKSSESLIKAGIVMLIASGIFNLTNFLYHFLSARMLGPAEYSIVASLFSIVYLVSIFSTTIQNTTTKFIAGFKAKDNNNSIIYFFKRGSKRLLGVSVIILIIYLILSPLISNFLKIPLTSVLILSLFILLSALIPLNRGVLQGLQKFNALGTNIVIEGVIKLGLALLLIYAGFKANGAIAAVAVATLIAFILTYPLIKLGKPDKKPVILESKEIYKFSIISFIALFLITAIYSIDIFLVKHFLSAEMAGHYAALSLLGKIVFFGATAIGIVMFPKISEMHTNKQKTKAVFMKSLIFTLLISALIVAVYFLFSSQIVHLVLGASYADISPLLGLFGGFMLLLSLSYVCVLHKLAIGKKRFIWNLLIAVILEIILICLFHNSLIQIIWILIALNLILLASLLIKK